MVDWLGDWAEAIIIAVIIATIIEMILPDGSSKKYIKVVVGVYILFTVISPVITKLTGSSLAVSDVLDLNEYIEEIKEKEIAQNSLEENNYTSIRDIYIGNLRADIQSKLKGKGYNVKDLELDVGYDDNYTLNKITLSISKEEIEEETEDADSVISNVEMINEININISNTISENEKKEDEEKSKLSNSDKNKIKEYLSSVYEINEKNIEIN